jgi:hypothetical protein
MANRSPLVLNNGQLQALQVGDNLTVPNGIGAIQQTETVTGSGYVVGAYFNTPLTGGIGTSATFDSYVAGNSGFFLLYFHGGTPVVTPSTVVGLGAGTHNIGLQIDGAPLTYYTITAGPSDTMTSIASLLQTQLGVLATVIAQDEGLLIISAMTGPTSNVLCIGGTLVYNILAALSTTALRESSVSAVSGSPGQVQFFILNGGSNYSVGDVLTAANSYLGGSGSGFSTTVFSTMNSNNVAIGGNALSSPSTAYNNVAVGSMALTSNTTGYGNTSVGTGALKNNSTANYNVALGTKALEGDEIATNTGSGNVAIGYGSMQSNSSGTYNIAIGYGSMQSNSSGINNIAIGRSCMSYNTIGYRNTAAGNFSLSVNTVGHDNAAFGYNAGCSLTTSDNTAVGSSALVSASTGYRNTAVGAGALSITTTGYLNCAVGFSACGYQSTGHWNNAFGALALQANNTGYSNNAFGTNALHNNTGSQNSAFGDSAGNGHTSGNNNTFLGNGASGSTATASNEFTLGNASVATLRCHVTSITSLSDVRDKTDIAPLTFGLEFLSSLNPVSFTWNSRDGSKIGVKSSGFIAQELKTSQEAVGASDTLNLVYENNPDKLEATYGNLIPVLVKAIQDLNAKVDQLQAEINTLKSSN